MRVFFNTQKKTRFQTLEKDAISFMQQLFQEKKKETDFLERFCLISGISKERMLEICNYSQKVAENLETNFTHFSVQELHSVCNTIRFLAMSYEDTNKTMEKIATESDLIIENWMELVEDFHYCSKHIFDELLKHSGISSSEEFFSTYHIFADTSALCDKNMTDVLDIVIPEMKKLEKPLKITVPKAVLNSLQTMTADGSEGVETGVYNLKKIQSAGLLSVRGDSADATVMSTFLSAFSRFKPIYKMMLITSDETLANAVNVLNNSGLEGTEILICKVDETDTLALWFKGESSDTDEFLEETPLEEESFVEMQFTEEVEQENDFEADTDKLCEETALEEESFVEMQFTEEVEQENDFEADTNKLCEETPLEEEFFEADPFEDDFFEEDIFEDDVFTEQETFEDFEETSYTRFMDEEEELSDEDEFDEKVDEDDDEEDDDEDERDFFEDDIFDENTSKSNIWNVLNELL